MKVKSCLLMLAGLYAAGCVDHRPVRNGLVNESIYVEKAALTEPAEGRDDAWLYKVTVVEASSPNVLGDYAFPGVESDLYAVNFRFTEDKLQVLDGRRLQPDDPEDPNDDTSTRAERVVMEFEGEHVDVKLRENLDGERTNYLEENTEERWQRRQKFKVDFETASMDPITAMAWYYGDYLTECARPTSVNLVDDTYQWEPDDDYLSFVLEANYAVTTEGGCYDLVSLATGTGTVTIRYRLSFWRPPVSEYKPEVVAEKDPVNKKYGAFQQLSLYRDPVTGLLDAKSLLKRFDPNREEPVVYYFHPGFPPKFKPMFDEIEEETNEVLAESGARLRVDFRDHDDGGVEREFGDLRYSFVAWHQDIDSTRGLLGYGPSTAHPRTGETISANVNLYNVGLDYYRYLIDEFLTYSGAEQPDLESSCEPGERAAKAAPSTRLRSALFTEMRRVMDLPDPGPDDDPAELFLPTPARGRDAFLEDYHRMLPEYRYVRPEWNQYVYMQSRTPIANFQERMSVERQFDETMHSILMNENPYGPVGLYGRDGIEAQNDFADKMRQFRRNHDELEADREDLLARKNIYVFDAQDAISAVANGARACKDDGTWETDAEFTERVIEDVVAHVAIHEFGHTLGLRHNFYGSVDAKHMEGTELSSSVMDYVQAYQEAGSQHGWGGYDRAALTWIYGTKEKREEVMAQDYLYCTDEHRYRSPLCTAHDLGVTPSQIVLNSIERYDWLYNIRNRRAYRTFWDTSAYTGTVYSDIFSLQRMWYLGIFDWAGGGVQQTLKSLDQVTPGRKVLTDEEYDAISVDFYDDISSAIDLTMAFYDAIINQPASQRNYQTEFDPFFGDVLRLGIVVDKLYASYAFMDLQDVYNYNPNVSTYVSMYDAPFGERNAALSQRVLDNMLGASYDTFPWFRFLAVNLFASATNTNLVDNLSLKERIAIQRFENQEEFELVYGAEALAEATSPDNPAQLFVHDGEQFSYAFLPDQGWHLVASRSRSPVSFQFMKDYNEDLNAGRPGDLDNYGLKILLAYYEYYNNFTGF